MLHTPKKNIDILAIGDTVVDAFIQLQVAETHVDEKTGQKTICMPFGDKVPFKESTEVAGVGNSANAAVSSARLGLRSALLTHVGNDVYGQKSIDSLTKDGVITDYIYKEEGKKTNYHYVLWYQDERTILINHELYTYHIPGDLMVDTVPTPSYIYLSSLGENSLPFHMEVESYLTTHPEVKLIFQPGTFQMKFGTDALKNIYAKTHIFFCNKEEAIRILQLDISSDYTMQHLLLQLRTLGVRLPIITDGPKGSYTFDIDMTHIEKIEINENTPVIHMPIYPDPVPPLERTGAGDAFASTCTAALIRGKDIRTGLIWGSINSMSVCQHIGAQKGLLTERDIQGWINKAPKNWKITTISG